MTTRGMMTAAGAPMLGSDPGATVFLLNLDLGIGVPIP